MPASIFSESVIGTTYTSGYQLYFYDTGTTNDKTVYQDDDLTTPHTQPVVANSDGRFAPIYLDATNGNPKVVLHTDLDVEIWSLDPYPIDDITTLSSDLDTAESDITALEGRMTTAESDIDTLETESADFENRISQNETDIAALQGASTPITIKAACFFVGQNNPSFAQNSGFSTVTKNSDGQFDLTFSTAAANANYIVVPGLGPSGISSPLDSVITNRSTAGFRVQTWYTTGGSTRALTDRDVSLIVIDLDA